MPSEHLQQQGDLNCEVILPQPDDGDDRGSSDSMPKLLYRAYSSHPRSKGPWSESEYFAEIRAALPTALFARFDAFMGDWLTSREYYHDDDRGSPVGTTDDVPEDSSAVESTVATEGQAGRDAFVGDWLTSQDESKDEGVYAPIGTHDDIPDNVSTTKSTNVAEGHPERASQQRCSSPPKKRKLFALPGEDIYTPWCFPVGAVVIQGLTPKEISEVRSALDVHPTFFARSLATMWSATEHLPPRTDGPPQSVGQNSGREWHIVIRPTSTEPRPGGRKQFASSAGAVGSSISVYKSDKMYQPDVYIVPPACRFRFDKVTTSNECRLRLTEEISRDGVEFEVDHLPLIPLQLGDTLTGSQSLSGVDVDDTTENQTCYMEFNFDPKVFVSQAILYKDNSPMLGCSCRTHVSFWHTALLNAFNRNLQATSSDAHGIAYREVLMPGGPDITVLSRWHAHRQCIAFILEQLTHIKRSAKRVAEYGTVAMTMDREISDVGATFESRLVKDCDDLSKDAAALQSFLSDLGQVLIGTINVADANRSNRLSKKANDLALQAISLTNTSSQIAQQANQFASSANDLAERAMWLNFIAAVYLPLMLVTGIFGMNIKEINDGTPQWWACLTAFAIIGTPSIAAATWIFVKDRRAKRQRDTRNEQADESIEVSS